MPESGLKPERFRELFAAHLGFVWRVLRRHGVPERDLDDACQEVFLVVHRRLDDFEGRSSVRTWLYGIAVRVALGLRRRSLLRRERESALRDEADLAPDPLLTFMQRESLALIDEALRGLRPARREVFVLYELEGMSMAEVACALSIPENTALYRLYGAREEIRSFVERTGAVGPRAGKARTRRALP